MKLPPKSGHAGNCLPSPRQFFVRKRARHGAGRFKSPFDDFLRRPAHTACERSFKQFLAVR